MGFGRRKRKWITQQKTSQLKMRGLKNTNANAASLEEAVPPVRFCRTRLPLNDEVLLGPSGNRLVFADGCQCQG